MINPLTIGIISFSGCFVHVAYDVHQIRRDEQNYGKTMKFSSATSRNRFTSMHPSFYPAATAIKFLAAFALLIAARYFSIAYAKFFPYPHFSFMLMGTAAFATYEAGSLITLIAKHSLKQQNSWLFSSLSEAED